MADKKTVDVELGLLKGQQVENTVRSLSRTIGELIGQFDRAEDEATNAFEVEIVAALGRSKQAAVQLTKQFQDVNREIRATLASLNDLQSFRRGISTLRSGGAQTETDLAALQGARNQIKNNAFSNQVSMENALNKAYEDRLRIFRQFAHPDAQNGSRVLGIGTSAATSQTRITQPQQLKNAKDFLRAMGMEDIPHYVTDPNTGKRSTNPALREWAAEVERMRQAYIRDQIRVDQEMFSERAKSRREEMEVQRRELERQRSRGVQQARQSIQAEMSGIMSAPTDAERRSRFDDAVARAKAAAGTTVAPRIIDRNAERMWELAEARRGAKVQRAADARVTGGSIDPASRSVAATLDRFDFAGGAGVFSIQARLMANYAAMSAVMSSLSFLGKFTTELEQGLAQVQAISAATDTQMKSLEATIISVAKSSRYTAQEVAEAATLMAQAGLSVQDIAKALPAITNLAVGTGTDLSQTVDIVTSVLSAFHLQVEETKTVADTLTAAMNQSKLGIQQFQLGVQYAGNTAADAGISYTELAAALGGMADSGIKAGSTLGTGFRQLIVDLQSPTEKAQKVYERLGLTFNDLDIKSQGLFGVLRNLRDAGFDSTDAFEALEVRAAAAYSALVNDLPAVEDLNKSIRDTGAASSAAATQMDTMESRAIQFQNTLGAAIYEISKPLQEVIKLTLGALKGLLEAATAIAPAFQVLLSAGAAVALAYVAKSTFELAKGLKDLPDLLARARDSMVAARAAAAGLGTTTAATATATAAASNTIKISWVGISAAIGGVIGIVFAAATAYDMLSRAMGFHKKTIDELQAAVNETNDNLNANKQGLDAVSDAIERVNNQAANLTEGSENLSNMVDELNSRFGEFGLSMIDSAKNADDLRNALLELEQQMLSVRQLQLEKKRMENEDLYAAKGAALKENIKENVSFYTPFSNRPANLRDDEWAMLQKAGPAFSFQDYLKMDPTALAEQTMKEFTAISSTRNFLKGRAQGTAEGARKDTLDRLVNSLDKTLQLLSGQASNASDILKINRDQGRTEKDLTVTGIRTSESYKAAEASANQLWSQMNTRMNNIRSQGLSLTDEIDALTKAAQDYKGPVEALMKARAGQVATFGQALGLTQGQAEVEFAKTDLAHTMTAISSMFEQNLQSDDYRKANKETYTQRRDAAKAKIDTILTVARGKRRPNYDVSERDLMAAIKDFIEADQAVQGWDARDSDLTKDKNYGSGKADQIKYGDLERDENVAKWIEQLRQNYDMPARGSNTGRSKKQIDEELEATKRRIARLEAEIRKAVQSVDSQSAPEAIQGVIDSIVPLQDEWNNLKNKELDLKYEKANWEDPANFEALKQQIYEDFNAELEAMAEATGQKLDELLSDVTHKILQKKFESQQGALERSLDSYLSSLRIFSEDQLDMAVLHVNASLDEIAKAALAAFDNDPGNVGRLNNPLVQYQRDQLVAGIMGMKTKIFRGLLDSYDAGLPADLTRDANADQLRYDQHATRLQYYGIPTSGLSHVNRAIGDKWIAAAEASVQAATDYKDKLAEDRKAIEDAMVGASGDQLQTLKDNLAENNKLELEANNILMDRLDLLEQVKMKYFDMSRDALDVSKVMTLTLDGIWGGITNGLAGAIAESFQGLEDMDKAFQNLGISILRTLEQMAAQILADQILMWILDIFFPGSASAATTGKGFASRIGNAGRSTVKRKAMGGENPNRDSILALLAPGEGVLSKPAMDVLGQDQFRKLNSRGNRLLNETAQRGGEVFQKREPDEVNVYLVQKDSIPPMTKKDVVMAIGQDILESGQTKRLIKQVVMGKV